MKYCSNLGLLGGSRLRAYLSADDDSSPLCETQLLIPIVIYGYVDSVAGDDDQIEELGIFVSKIGLDGEASVSDAEVEALKISAILH